MSCVKVKSEKAKAFYPYRNEKSLPDGGLTWGMFRILQIKFFLPFHFSLFLCLLLTSCDDSFEPFQENNEYFFTIYGYLDATADTQWVRIAPARQLYDAPPEIPEMQVSLTHLENDSTINMNTSVVQFSQGFNALNVWSEMKPEAGNSYHLRAERPDGASSRVTVTLPEDFPAPRLLIVTVPSLDPEYTLLIDGVEHLADVQSRWYVRLSTPGWEEKKIFRFSYKNEAQNVAAGSYRVPMYPDEEMEGIMNETLIAGQPDGEVEFLHHQLFVASAGPEWVDDISSMDDLVYALPEGLSNVEDGLGYMVGVVSKLVPFESCRDDQGRLVSCPEEKPFWYEK